MYKYILLLLMTPIIPSFCTLTDDVVKALYESNEVLEKLLNENPDFDVNVQVGSMPLLHYLMHDQVMQGLVAMPLDTQLKNIQTLIDHGANVNAFYGFEIDTPLLTVQQIHPSKPMRAPLIKLLLENGANPLIPNSFGMTSWKYEENRLKNSVDPASQAAYKTTLEIFKNSLAYQKAFVAAFLQKAQLPDGTPIKVPLEIMKHIATFVGQPSKKK